uniref:C2H2-type domain-containing protein n=1 Tax=Anopheles atroparvus TaxID=41427 RepID=A0A182J037_ANOAO
MFTDQNADDISDFDSFKLNYKQVLDLQNEDESEWSCAEGIDFVYLFVPEKPEEGVVHNIDHPTARHGILIDKKLNVKIESNDEEVDVSLPQGEPLASYSQLLTLMYVLTEPLSYDEEYTNEEWLESDGSQPDLDETSLEATLDTTPLELEGTSAGEGTGKFKCSYCPKTFTRPIRRREHENVHTGKKPYVCTICLRGFSASSGLVAHKQLHHGVRNHACPDCGKTFHRRRNMRLHHRLVHLGEKPYVCPICQRPYTDNTCFKRHIERHSQSDTVAPERKVASASAAPKPSKGKVQNLDPPVRPPKPTKPPKSPKGARRTRNTLPKRYPCELCGQMFARRRNVEYHVTYTHTGIKPHECEFCGKKYSDITSFKRHIRVHTELSVQQQSVAGEAIVFQRNEATAPGDQAVTVLQDLHQNAVITSYIILD